jgi:hypothetical protein
MEKGGTRLRERPKQPATASWRAGRENRKEEEEEQEKGEEEETQVTGKRKRPSAVGGCRSMATFET